MIAHLTLGGNLLILHPHLDKYYFASPSGKFLREVSNNEAEHLKNQCLEIILPSSYKDFPEFFPQWTFLGEFLIETDATNFLPEESNNGGKYVFYTYQSWFVAKHPNQEWQFAYMNRTTTSAGFEFDEITGQFTNPLKTIRFDNVSGYCPTFSTQFEYSILEEIACISNFRSLWKSDFVYLPSRWFEDQEQYIPNALTVTDKKNIIRTLKKLGMNKNVQRKR